MEEWRSEVESGTDRTCALTRAHHTNTTPTPPDHRPPDPPHRPTEPPTLRATELPTHQHGRAHCLTEICLAASEAGIRLVHWST